MTINFESLLAHSPNPYVVLAPDLKIVWANHAYLRVTMRELDDIAGLSMFEAFPSEGESYRQLKDSFDRVLATGEPDEIAHIRYDIPNRDGSTETHFWSATHTPILDAGGAVELILQHTVNVTELKELRRLRDSTGVLERARTVEERYQGAAAERERLRNLLAQAPGFVAILTGPEHRFAMANAAYRDLVGHRELIGLTVAEALPEVIEQGFVETLDRVHSEQEPYFGRREPVSFIDQLDGKSHDAFLEFIFQPIFEPSGQVAGVFVQGHNVTEEVEAEERQRILINELNHRVKNTLAVVQGLARQSFRSDDRNPGLQAFFARLATLAGAHNMLTESNWASADISDIVVKSLAASVGSETERVSLDGPQITLDPQAAVALAMVVHELATNALKYGALSSSTGRISISWDEVEQDENRMLQFDWHESGGPSVEKPEQTGFGTRLIGRGLGGRRDHGSIDYNSEGLHCSIEAEI